MKLIDGQILGIFSQVLYRHAEIVSGAYKQSGRQIGCGRNDNGTIAFRDLTEEEKLADSMAVMKRQIVALGQHIDAIGDEPAD